MTRTAAMIPADACRFAAPVQFEAGTSPTDPRRISGVAYSGDVLAHPYWSAVVFDLATTQAPDRLPVLVEHDRAQRAGVASLRITPERIEIESGTLLRNATGTQVAADADAGFPWQLSVHIEPREVQQLAAGERATVNGRDVAGPAAIFRNATIREVSFTPTGIDPSTSAAVFSVRRSTPVAPAPAAPTSPPPSVRDSVTADPHRYAAAIRAEQDRAEGDGERITVLEAARRVRDAAAA